MTNTDPENTHVLVQQADQEVEGNPLDLKHGVNNLQKFCYNSKPAKQDRKKDFEPSRVREMLAEKSIGW